MSVTVDTLVGQVKAVAANVKSVGGVFGVTMIDAVAKVQPDKSFMVTI